MRTRPNYIKLERAPADRRGCVLGSRSARVHAIWPGAHGAACPLTTPVRAAAAPAPPQPPPWPWLYALPAACASPHAAHLSARARAPLARPRPHIRTATQAAKSGPVDQTLTHNCHFGPSSRHVHMHRLRLDSCKLLSASFCYARRRSVAGGRRVVRQTSAGWGHPAGQTKACQVRSDLISREVTTGSPFRPTRTSAPAAPARPPGRTASPQRSLGGR